MQYNNGLLPEDVGPRCTKEEGYGLPHKLSNELNRLAIAGCTSATIVLSKGKGKVEERKEKTTNAHYKPGSFRQRVLGTSRSVQSFSDRPTFTVLEVGFV